MKRIWKKHKCGYCGINTFCDVHHVIPRSKGGTNHKSNLIYLCPNCHRNIHAGELKLDRKVLTTEGYSLL